MLLLLYLSLSSTLLSLQQPAVSHQQVLLMLHRDHVTLVLNAVKTIRCFGPPCRISFLNVGFHFHVMIDTIRCLFSVTILYSKLSQ